MVRLVHREQPALSRGGAGRTELRRRRWTRAEIDAKTRTVVLRLDETTDISRVRITDMRITAEARASAPLTGEFDLRTPQFITLSLYQDYEWELRAEQRIERRFAVEGQIGARK